MERLFTSLTRMVEAAWVASASVIPAQAGMTLTDGFWNMRNIIGKLRRFRLPLPPIIFHLERAG